MYKSQHVITCRHYLLFCICAFILGIFLTVRFGISSAIVFILVTFSASILTLLLIFLITQRKTKKKLILSALLAAFALLGVFRIFIAESPDANTLKGYINEEAWVYGTVASEPQLTRSGYSYTFEMDVFCVNHDNSASGTIIMYIPKSRGCTFHAGDNIYCWARLSVPEAGQNSSSYDYYTALKGKNIFVTGSTKNINPMQNVPDMTPWLGLRLAGGFVRSKITNAADCLLEQNPQSSAILKGILLGDKSGFDDELYSKLANSGISHIVAVSGLHLSILFSFLIMLMTSFKIRRKLCLFLTIPFIILFMSASAFTPSVCRASLMILLTIASAATREEYDPVTSLFFALGCILTVSPYALFSKSLVLSFSATLGIFVYFGYINELLNIPCIKLRHKFLASKPIKAVYSYLTSSIALSAASLIGTAYFLILFFEGISTVQFLTNLLVIPFISIIFCLGYITCIVFYILPWFAEHILIHPLGLLLEFINIVIGIFGKDVFFLPIPSADFTGAHAIIYFGAALMIYMTLKAVHDIRKEKKLKNSINKPDFFEE